MPRETSMRPLCAGKRRRRNNGRSGGRSIRFHLHLHALVAKEMDAGMPMNPATPVIPSDGFTPDHERMKQHADLARFGCGAALPLTLVAQRTGTATANAGSIHDAQTAIDLSALLMGDQRVPSRTP